MKWVLILVLLMASPALAFKATQSRYTELECKALVIYKESRSEPLQGSRAVLDVLHNRMREGNLPACAVAKAKGQFPWMAKKHYKITKDMLTRLNKVSMMKPVLNKKYLFFNTKPHKFGKKVKKIGNHYFTQ